ncbi:hypothetical protein EL17_22370 [Anditalea andensis]|uniref:Uncharacterized protein n=1 Tax=Anditalea andensis TaxID=1048983 RepID=A0A074L7E3_9BACT|nr:hypothetical protein EL17_22370 [Anditalea andensis]
MLWKGIEQDIKTLDINIIKTTIFIKPGRNYYPVFFYALYKFQNHFLKLWCNPFTDPYRGKTYTGLPCPAQAIEIYPLHLNNNLYIRISPGRIVCGYSRR